MSELTNYYLISFNTEIDNSDLFNPQATNNLEGFCFLGDECQYFEELMGADDRLPVNAGQVLRNMQLVRRMNPHRHIRIYAVKSPIEEDELRSFCTDDPVVAEMAIKESGVEM